MNIYELYGRQAEKLEQASEYLIRTCKLLKAIKDGEVDIKDVDASVNGWEIKEAKSEG